MVDYPSEMADPRTVRAYEWQGLTTIVGRLTALTPETRWLDYGAGLGGLVRHGRESVGCEIVGFEEGYAGGADGGLGDPSRHPGRARRSRRGLRRRHRNRGDRARRRPGRGAPGPRMRVLAPGGLVYLTTGNAEPPPARLTRWAYTGVPDVHVGFFEPATLATALEAAGFEVVWPGFVDGLDDVIRYKVLKTPRIHRTSAVERALPWRSLAKVVDTRHRVSAMPAGRRPR